MKKFFAIAFAMFLTAGAAFAQDNYTRVQVSYVSNKMTSIDYLGDKDLKPKGINAALMLGFPISDSQPLYIEPGINLTWAHSAVDYEEVGLAKAEFKFTYMNAAIPINCVYRLEFNDNVALCGHAGLNFKVNFMAKQHNNYTEEITNKKFKESYSWLSKKDMGGRDDRANIFQLGGQVGAGFQIQRLYIGYQFQTDFMKFQKMESLDGDAHRWITNYITLGVTL